MRKRQTVELMSAGGLVYRTDGERGIEVVICGREYPAVWGLPKGTPDPGETEEQTALREVREETGLDVVTEGYIDSIRYWFVRASDGARCHKIVHYYLMSPIGGDLSRHDHEFDFVVWTSASEASRTLTYENEVEIVQKGASMVGEGVRGD